MTIVHQIILCLLLPFVLITTQQAQAAAPSETDSDGGGTTLSASNIKGRSMQVAWHSAHPGADYVLTVSSENGCVTYDHLTDSVLTLTGLSPQTHYTLQLRAIVDGLTASTTELEQSTTPLQFSELPCKASQPTNIADHSFVARWQPVANAEHYFVSVFERVPDTTGTISYGFPGVDSPLPFGWSSSSNSLSHDFYGESGIFSLRLHKDRDSLVIVAMGDSLIKGLRFWWCGSQSDNSLCVRTLDSNGLWHTAGTLLTVEGKDSIANYTFDGAYALCISFNRQSGGYACIDDINVTVAMPHDHPVVGMRDLDAGKANELAIHGLRPGTQYSYQVYATAKGQRTAVSKPIILQTLTDLSAIATVDASSLSGPINFYDLSGRRVDYMSAPAGIYIVRKGGKTYKVMKK